ncbi:hypothetical protein AAKU64_002092 [Undibacterium sp. GrIS 1.8]
MTRSKLLLIRITSTVSPEIAIMALVLSVTAWRFA